MHHAADFTFAARAPEYRRLWAEMEITPRCVPLVGAAVHTILAGSERYRAVEARTGVPWWMIGIIHSLECSCSFEKHLHNGDSLRARTWQVPAGRPRTGSPPFKWEDSAVDALVYQGLDKVATWSIEFAAFYWEKYNGLGYWLNPSFGVDSPYLWSFSNLYIMGKYRTDGHYDPHLKSEQAGAMVLLRGLMDLDASIAPAFATPPPALADAWVTTTTPAAAPEPAGFAKAHPPSAIASVVSVLPSRRLWGTIFAFLATVLQLCRDAVNHAIDAAAIAFGALPAITNETKETLDAGELVVGWLKGNWEAMLPLMAIACLIFVAVRHVLDERHKPKVSIAPTTEAPNA